MGWAEDLTEVATRRGPALVGYAYLLTGELAGAEDLVQEAFARTFARPRKLAGAGATEAYVRRTLLHAYIDGYRRDQVWGRVRHLVAESDHADDRPPDRTADRLDVQAALADLPPRERVCVVLRYFDDLTVPALADQLGISPGTAKRYLSDGLHRLGVVLGPLGQPAETTAIHLTEGSER